ncbi:MAG: hypothetical protein RL398_3143 [Planctomycetota bacterium]
MLRPLCAILAAVCLLPDEGQWLPTQVRDMDWAALQKRGMKLTKDEFWHPEKGGVLSATVQINGCTASFCAPDGLLVTNHHCGFDAVSQLSSPETNHLRDGFAAQTLQDELPAPGMVASVLKRIEDVTAIVHQEQQKAKDDLERWAITQRVLAKLVAEGERKEANTKCSVASFLEGKEYHLYYRTQIRDVRLVYAPPRAIGEFGGEVDNWEWPRHTGDFTFFRAYVAKDGSVGDYSADNVPFRAEHVLKVTKDPIQDGDLAIVMGYPGRTQRYKSSRAVASQEGFVYPARDRVLTAAIETLEQAGTASEQKALDVAPRIKSLANVQKNARGMIFGLSNNKTVQKKLKEEQEFRNWLKQGGKAQAEWQSVLDELLALDELEASMIERDTFVWFLRVLGEEMPLLSGLMEACSAAARDGDGRVPARLRTVLAQDQFAADWESIQAPLLATLLEELAGMAQDRRIPGTEFVGNGQVDPAVAAALLKSPALLDGKARAALLEGGRQALEASDDPMVKLCRALATETDAWRRRAQLRLGQDLDVGRRWIAAQEAFRGKGFYPDANSTLRVAIGAVKGYAPRDGLVAVSQTTVAGLLQKEKGKEPFANPKALLEAAKTRMDSRWVDKKLGDVPVCFLMDGDTTGGNSGSPVINGKGELIGLNFDRVFEAVAGDFGWNADRSRNVVCDIRYVLWVIESVQPCPRLQQELLGA